MPKWSRRKGGAGQGTRRQRRSMHTRYCLEWTDGYGVSHMRMLDTRNVAEYARERFQQAGYVVTLTEV